MSMELRALDRERSKKRQRKEKVWCDVCEDVLGLEALKGDVDELADFLCIPAVRLERAQYLQRLARTSGLWEMKPCHEHTQMSAPLHSSPRFTAGKESADRTYRPGVKLGVDSEPALLPADLAEVLLARTPGVYKRRVDLCVVQ